jgi:serine/threonine-protein kinase
MIKCQACRTENFDNSQYCDECGALLTSRKESNVKTPSFEMSEKPIFQSASITSIGIPPIVDESVIKENSFEKQNAPKTKNISAALVIERGEAVGREFPLSASESHIGRWDADNGIFPDIDLDALDPEAKVSRRHARITRQNETYTIEDLGSTNGTFVNRGRRLIPGAAQPIKDGDEIIVGKTFMRFYVNQ